MPFISQHPISKAQGMVLAHSLKIDTYHYAKGHALQKEDIQKIQAFGIQTVSGFLLDPSSEYTETDAITRLVACLGKHHPCFTFQIRKGGKALGIAAKQGMLNFNPSLIQSLNLISPAITLATLPSSTEVARNTTCIVLKIIPFGIKRQILDQAITWIKQQGPCLSILPCQKTPLSILHTSTPSPSLQHARAISSIAKRIQQISLTPPPLFHHHAPHTAAHLKSFILESVNKKDPFCIIAPEHSEVDAQDLCGAVITTIPNGKIITFGIPAEPGHLCLIGKVEHTTIVVFPSCARLNTAPNGVDSILKSLLYQHPITPERLAHIAIGGVFSKGTSHG